MSYRKIPKISPGACIFQRPFLKRLYSEGLMYGGKICVKKSIMLAYSWKEIYHFFSLLLCI